MHLLLKESPEKNSLEEIGRKALKNKKVCILTLAGGSGSRLGYDRPKGTFVLPTKNTPALSLFQRQAEKISSLGAPWVIMVSNETMRKTVEHFQQSVLRRHKIEVFFIVQEDIDALDKDTKAPLFNEKNEPIKVPNGNGSVFEALKRKQHYSITTSSITSYTESIISKLPQIEYFNIVSIDNVLVNIGDPLLVGYATKHKLDVASAGIPEDSRKKMGVFEIVEGRVEVSEYTYKSRNPPLVNANGQRLANIANHLISREYIKRITVRDIPYNEAIKKIPHKDNPNPDAPNAIKRELFIFDGFKWAANHGVVEYTAEAYEGLKNKDGESDSIETCTKALDRQ